MMNAMASCMGPVGGWAMFAGGVLVLLLLVLGVAALIKYLVSGRRTEVPRG